MAWFHIPALSDIWHDRVTCFVQRNAIKSAISFWVEGFKSWFTSAMVPEKHMLRCSLISLGPSVTTRSRASLLNYTELVYEWEDTGGRSLLQHSLSYPNWYLEFACVYAYESMCLYCGGEMNWVLRIEPWLRQNFLTLWSLYCITESQKPSYLSFHVIQKFHFHLCSWWVLSEEATCWATSSTWVIQGWVCVTLFLESVYSDTCP